MLGEVHQADEAALAGEALLEVVLAAVALHEVCFPPSPLVVYSLLSHLFQVSLVVALEELVVAVVLPAGEAGPQDVGASAEAPLVDVAGEATDFTLFSVYFVLALRPYLLLLCLSLCSYYPKYFRMGSNGSDTALFVAQAVATTCMCALKISLASCSGRG